MNGETEKNAEFYQKEIASITNKIDDIKILNYIYIIVSDIFKEVLANEEN